MTAAPTEFAEVFRIATGEQDPFPFQNRLAAERWPDVLHVPTGLGKTAAVGLAWIHGRITEDPETPRRLIYCLPMRVLVEQTCTEFERWLENLDLLGTPEDPDRIEVHVLMGGEQDLRTAPWARHPERAQVLIGTQDMLVSRALMRGYGMSRYQWPVHFGLFHVDALWVFDEVQLMGPALATSAQLEAFRRDRVTMDPDVVEATPAHRPARSLWVSATLRPEWLGTVDFRPHLDGLEILEAGTDDRRVAEKRLAASKRLGPATVTLDAANAKRNARAYVGKLADFVMERHVEDTQTLVIVNRVDRAQRLARALEAANETVAVLLVHSRFREEDRRELNRKLRQPAGDRIIVATQAVEAGVDLSSRTLITELAPWDSLVQRFGRCNRRGEYAHGTDLFWVDIEDESGEGLPYEDEELAEARAILESLSSASPADLPPVGEHRPSSAVLRWRDLSDLFDTDPDLSGFDLDVSHYIRDTGSPQVLVFWRDFGMTPAESQPAPERQEICSFSMSQIRDYLRKKSRGRTRPAWIRDSLAGRWTPIRRLDRVRPGMTLMLEASGGGYDPMFGAQPTATAEVPVCGPTEEAPADSYDGDEQSQGRQFVSLRQHTSDVGEEMRSIAASLDLGPEETESLVTAARWHDLGKAHPAFQAALLKAANPPNGAEGGPWAKSSGGGRLRYHIVENGRSRSRRHFRHELASMLAWLRHGHAGEADDDLVAYLILSHHGRVRMRLRALPTEAPPPDDRLFARGVHEGDLLPPVSLDGLEVPETTLRLGIMRLGLGEAGPSWTERSQALLCRLGPFHLAWLEALLRIADWRASAREDA